jgi:hypothetical protein
MSTKKDQLKDKVVALVKDYLTNEGGITPYDIEVLFGQHSLAKNVNEVATSLAQLTILLR